MKFAICNETFGEMPLAEALAIAAENGYTGWEVAPFMLAGDTYTAAGDTNASAGNIDAFDQTHRRAYREAVESAGLRVIGLHWLLAKTTGFHLTTIDGEVRRRTAEHLGKLATLCRDLGGDLMVLGSPGQRNYPDSQSEALAMENAAEVLRAVAPELDRTGVSIAVEPLGPAEGNFLNTAAAGRRLIDMVDDPRVRLHLDVKAMSSESDSIEQIIRDNADAMIHFHANDPNLLGPGMGEVDFRPIVAALRDVGYDGFVSVEVFDYSPGPQTIAAQSIANLKAALADVAT